MEVVGNESNQEKLLPTCTNVMADCQNSIMQEKKHQAVCLQSESDRATLIWLEWAAPPSLGVLWSTEPWNHQGWKRPPGSSSSKMSTAPPRAALNCVPKCHLCTSSLPMAGQKTISFLSVKTANVKRQSQDIFFQEKYLISAALSAFTPLREGMWLALVLQPQALFKEQIGCHVVHNQDKTLRFALHTKATLSLCCQKLSSPAPGIMKDVQMVVQPHQSVPMESSEGKSPAVPQGKTQIVILEMPQSSHF